MGATVVGFAVGVPGVFVGEAVVGTKVLGADVGETVVGTGVSTTEASYVTTVRTSNVSTSASSSIAAKPSPTSSEVASETPSSPILLTLFPSASLDAWLISVSSWFSSKVVKLAWSTICVSASKGTSSSSTFLF